MNAKKFFTRAALFFSLVSVLGFGTVALGRSCPPYCQNYSFVKNADGSLTTTISDDRNVGGIIYSYSVSGTGSTEKLALQNAEKSIAAMIDNAQHAAP
jgi:hypothetical protein